MIPNVLPPPYDMSVYHFELSTDIAAPVSRVWRALCDPAAVVQWDSGVTEAINPPADYPQPGQTVGWRYRSRWFPVLFDRPQEVVAEHKLRSLLRLGPYEMDETYTLSESPAGCRLALTVDLQVRLPLVGRTIERVWAGRDTRRGFEASLDGLKRWCEGIEVDNG